MKERILFVDDDQEILLTYKIYFKDEYDVTVADSGEDALTKIDKDNPFAVVVSDYRMGGISGVEFLKKVKEVSEDSVRVIVTSQTDIKTAIKAVNESNIFRFIAKPANKNELETALKDSIDLYKLITSEKELNRKLSEAYETIKKDLESASNLQRSLLPKDHLEIEGIVFNSVFIPSVLLSGDTFNYFRLDENHVAFYLLDVAGHGITPALLSFVLSSYLTPDIQKDTPLKNYDPTTETYSIVQPREVIQKLNQRFLTTGNSMDYFTMTYGVINIPARELVLCNAAHPVAVKCEGTSNVQEIGVRNFPVGVFENVDFKEVKIKLEPNDKLLIYSDGLIESKNQKGEMFGLDRLEKFISSACPVTFDNLVTSLKEQLIKWHGSADFQDDVTFFTLELKN